MEVSRPAKLFSYRPRVENENILVWNASFLYDKAIFLETRLDGIYIKVPCVLQEAFKLIFTQDSRAQPRAGVILPQTQAVFGQVQDGEKLLCSGADELHGQQ